MKPARKPGEQGTTRASREKLPTCGAKNRQGQPCARPAGHGTSHPGLGRCKLHGGTTQKFPLDRYAELQTGDRLRDLLAKAQQDPDPLDLTQDLALMRALMQDLVERHSDYNRALMAWHGSWDSEAYRQAVHAWRGQCAAWVLAGMQGDMPKPPHPEDLPGKPRQIVDLSYATKIISEIGSLTDKIHKHRAGQKDGHISLVKLDEILERLGVELVEAAREVRLDESTRAALLGAVERRWGGITLDGLTPAAWSGPGPGRGAHTLN